MTGLFIFWSLVFIVTGTILISAEWFSEVAESVLLNAESFLLIAEWFSINAEAILKDDSDSYRKLSKFLGIFVSQKLNLL